MLLAASDDVHATERPGAAPCGLGAPKASREPARGLWGEISARWTAGGGAQSAAAPISVSGSASGAAVRGRSLSRAWICP